jgi:hypothetical protein
LRANPGEAGDVLRVRAGVGQFATAPLGHPDHPRLDQITSVDQQ